MKKTFFCLYTIIFFCLVSCGNITNSDTKENQTGPLLKIKVESNNYVRLVNAETGADLQYNKLIIFGKEIDRIFYATVGDFGSLGVGVSWKEVIPPNAEAKEFTKIIDHDQLKKV